MFFWKLRKRPFKWYHQCDDSVTVVCHSVTLVYGSVETPFERYFLSFQKIIKCLTLDQLYWSYGCWKTQECRQLSRVCAHSVLWVASFSFQFSVNFTALSVLCHMHNLWSHCFRHQIHTSHRTRMAGLQGLRGRLVGKTTSTWTFLHGLGSHHYISCNLNFSYTFWFEIFIIMFISHSKRINTQSSCIYKKTIKATFRYKNKNTHILLHSRVLNYCLTASRLIIIWLSQHTLTTCCCYQEIDNS